MNSNPLSNLAIDYWYKAVLVIATCVLIAALSVEMQGVENNVVQLLAMGLILVGLGEWINHPLQVSIAPAYKITSYRRSSSFGGNLLDLIGVVLMVIGFVQMRSVEDISTGQAPISNIKHQSNENPIINSSLDIPSSSKLTDANMLNQAADAALYTALLKALEDGELEKVKSRLLTFSKGSEQMLTALLDESPNSTNAPLARETLAQLRIFLADRSTTVEMQWQKVLHEMRRAQESEKEPEHLIERSLASNHKDSLSWAWQYLGQLGMENVEHIDFTKTRKEEDAKIKKMRAFWNGLANKKDLDKGFREFVFSRSPSQSGEWE